MHPQDRMRLERGAAFVHRLGPRATAELLIEIADAIGGLPCIMDRLTRYQTMTPAMIRAAGDDRFPPRPLHRVAS